MIVHLIGVIDFIVYFNVIIDENVAFINVLCPIAIISINVQMPTIMIFSAFSDDHQSFLNTVLHFLSK